MLTQPGLRESAHLLLPGDTAVPVRADGSGPRQRLPRPRQSDRPDSFRPSEPSVERTGGDLDGMARHRCVAQPDVATRKQASAETELIHRLSPRLAPVQMLSRRLGSDAAASSARGDSREDSVVDRMSTSVGPRQSSRRVVPLDRFDVRMPPSLTAAVTSNSHQIGALADRSTGTRRGVSGDLRLCACSPGRQTLDQNRSPAARSSFGDAIPHVLSFYCPKAQCCLSQ